MKRILLTMDEVVAAGSDASAKTMEALNDTLKKMEPGEIVSKYGERFLWAVITFIVGSIVVNWALKKIMSKVKSENIAPGATKFIHGIAAFLLYSIVILTCAHQNF